MSLEATRTLVRGRQPRSGLICILCNLCSYVPAVSGQYTLRLMFFCSYVLLFSALAANTHYNLCPYVLRVSKQIKRNQSLYDQFARPLHKKLYIC